MKKLGLLLLSMFLSASTGNIYGPLILWGHKELVNLHPLALSQLNEEKLESLFQNSEAICIFVRNSTKPLDSRQYPKLQRLLQDSHWTYLPQSVLTTNPSTFNGNVQFIYLFGDPPEEEEELLKIYNEAVSSYGPGKILGILSTQTHQSHSLRKREAKVAPEIAYIAEGHKAVLVVSKAPILYIGHEKSSMNLVEHIKGAVTFEESSSGRNGLLNIAFKVQEEKILLGFNFTKQYDTWILKACSVDYKDYQSYLPIVGTEYDCPSAPVHFSYRCGTRSLIFTNGNDTLNITDYQIQPWLQGSHTFGPAYDCVDIFSTPILAGLLITLFLGLIASIGIIAILEIKTPSRFENPRSKPLTFIVEEYEE